MAEAQSAGSGNNRPKERKRLHLRDVKSGEAPLETVGAELRAARLKKGEELDAIAVHLKIRNDILQALEDSDYEHHPAKVYAIGFVRTYARYLGLNADVMVKRYKAEISGRSHDRAPTLNFPAAAEERGFPGGSLVVLALAIGGLVYGAWVVTQPAITEGEPVVVTEAEAAKAASEAAALVPGPLGVPADPLLFAQQIAAPEGATAKVYGELGPEVRIVLRATEDCYVRVRDLFADAGPVVVFEQTLLKGESYRVPNRSGLSLRAGNAGGLVVAIDGKDMGPLGKPGDTADKVSLTAVKLIARYEGGGEDNSRQASDPRDLPAPSVIPQTAPAPTPASAPEAAAAPPPVTN